MFAMKSDRQSKGAMEEQILHRMLWATVMFSAFVLAGIFALRSSWPRIIFVSHGVLLSGVAGSMLALRRGRLKLAGALFLGVLGALLGVYVALSRGIFSPALVGLALIPSIAYWLLGRRTALWASGCITLSALLLAVLAEMGVRLPQRYPMIPINIWAFFALVVVINIGTIELTLAERKRAEEALRASEAKFRAIVEYSHEAILFLDLKGVTLYRSPATERLTGIGNEGRIGYVAFDWIHPDDLPAVRLAWTEVLQQAGIIRRVAYRARHKDGSWMWFDGLLQNYLDNPSIHAIVLTVRDITAQKGLEEQLRQSQKMEAIGQLAGGVAHDFNNLLTVINGYSILALNSLKADDPLRNKLQEIHKAGERAAGLTSQLLAFSRKQVMQPQTLDLNKALRNMESMLSRLMGEDVELRLELGPEAPAIYADPHQLEQVVMNLAVNARAAMPNGGTLLLETSTLELDRDDLAFHPEVHAGRRAMLAVSDTGVGMDETTRQRIFEPFFTTKEVGQGTGLGLSTVQGVVAQSGGHIDVYSEPGHGSTFKIYLPLSSEAGVVPPAKTAPPVPAGNGETILVVEDQPDLRLLTASVLREHGYRVMEASNGTEALAISKRPGQVLHLVLTDVVMPHCNGRELVTRMQKAFPQVKALYMSGYTDDVIVHHGVLVGDTPFIAKPFAPEELVAKIAEVLSQSRE
jgi:two-component system cell cycle sensor histidine kinase/response regulator CckA